MKEKFKTFLKFYNKIYKVLKQELNILWCKNHNPALLISSLYAGLKYWKEMQNIVTYKFEYTCENEEEREVIQRYINLYNNLVHCMYSYAFKNDVYSQNSLYSYSKGLFNVTRECGFVLGATYKVKELLNQQREAFDRLNKKRKSEKLFERTRQRKILFGGKTLWTQYLKGLISKEEFQEKRNFPVCSVGEKERLGNRHFRIQENKIIFQPNKELHIPLNIKISKQRKQDLKILEQLQNNSETPITYNLDTKYVYITFDLNKVREIQKYKSIKNRVFAIDMNPNYIGYSIVDWISENKYKIVDSGVISNEKLNEHDNSLKDKGFSVESKERKYITNKRKHETIEIAKTLINIAKHYKVEVFSMEDLSIDSKDTNKGKKINRLCNNQWNRNILINQIRKLCSLNSIRLLEVRPEYSSFVGNIIFRETRLPDMCLASIEIGTRGYEFLNQYINKTKEIKKNIVVPDVELFQNQISRTLEEIGYIDKFDGLRKLYYLFKKSKMKYRLLLTELSGEVSSMLSINSYLSLYKFKGVYT